MAGTIEPKPLTGAGAPELLRWAVAGTRLEPSQAAEAVGWQPQNIAPPPDYRIENYRDFALFEWLTRLQATSLLMERSTAILSVPAALVAGLTHILTLDGHASGAYVVPNGATQASVAAGIADLLNADATLLPLQFAIASDIDILITWTEPGHVFSYAHGGTGPALVVTQAPSTPIIRQAPTETWDKSRNLVVGSRQADDAGDANQDARLVFLKDKGGAFRVGKATGTQWDAGNVGDESVVAGGTDNSASGIGSAVLGGSNNVADHTGAIVVGGNAGSAQGTGAVVVGGSGGGASGAGAIALGGSGGVAFGDYAVVSGKDTTAGGTGSHADGDSSIASMKAEQAQSCRGVGFTAGAGEAQCGRIHVAVISHQAAGVEIVPGTGSVSWTPPDKGVFQCDYAVVAKKATDDSVLAVWRGVVTLNKIAGALAILMIANLKYDAATPVWETKADGNNLSPLYVGGAAAYILTISQDGAGSLLLEAFGVNATDVRWSGRLDYVSVSGGH